MARIIEAKAIISAQDNTGAVFDKIAKKIDKLGKSSKTSEAVERVAKAVKSAEVQMRAIDKFDMSRGGFVAARRQFRDAQADVERYAKAMAASEKPSSELERNYQRAQRAVSLASRAFEQQQQIVLSNKRQLEGMGVNVASAAAHQARLRTALETTSLAIAKQEKIEARAHARRLAMGTALAGAGALAAHGVSHGIRATLHTYREFDKERRFGKAVMGLSDEEQKPLVNQAIHMGAATKFNDIQVLEAQRELAARGLKKDQIMGMMGAASNLGMALDLRLPEAVKQMEGALFGFKKDISTLDASLASATRTADLQVKAAKLSGMTPEDITQLYKFGATPARMGGISEAALLGFGGILKKANIGGDEAGVAFRALMATIQSPTAGGKTAMLANGLNYKNYQRMRDSLDVDPFAADVSARYGVALNGKTRAGLAKIFNDKNLISDPAKFNPAVTAMLRETLQGNDAKSLKSIAGAAGRYRDSSIMSVDANGMIKDLLPKLANNLPLANKLFGSKQGGRIATALGDSATLQKIIDEIEKGSEGYSEKIAGERMAGFDGAVSRFEGAVKNLETAVGRGFDSDGKGGFLTGATNLAGSSVQWLAERDSSALAGGALGLGAGGLGLAGYGAWRFMKLMSGGFGLSTSAAALDAAAAALTGAATALNGGKAATAATTAATAAGGSSVWAAGAAALPYVAIGTAIAGGLYAMHEETKQYSGMTSGERLRKQRGGSMRDVFRQSFDGDRERLGIPPLGGEHGEVKAELSGSAEVKGEVIVRIEAPELIKAYASAAKVSGRLNTNGPGSAGHSSPDSRSSGQSGDW